MILLINKKHLRNTLLCLAAGCVAVLVWQTVDHRVVSTAADTAISQASSIVIIDPGHGGEDGGAVAADGTVESNINLAISKRLNVLLRFCGQECLMTRDSDVSIYSSGAKTLHEKKVSDLKNRVAIVNKTPNAVLVSVHQNNIPFASSVHGAQVFFNTKDGAKELADCIQKTLNNTINVGNKKTAKQISSTIYLMKNVKEPAVLIECGFLSNSSETKQLKTPAYQLEIAAVIASGLLNA